MYPQKAPRVRQATPARNAFKWCDCQETGYNLGHDSTVSLRSLWCCNMS